MNAGRGSATVAAQLLPPGSVFALGYTVEPGPAFSGQHAPTALDIVVRAL